MRLLRLTGRLLLAGLLVPAVLLTVARWLEPAGGPWVRTVSFTPFALVLYAAAFLLALAGAMRAGPGRRRPWVAAALVALVGLGVHAWWFSPQVVGANPPAAAESDRLTVMTANLLKGQADGIALMGAVAEAGVDVLVVQEVTAGAVATMERAGLSEILPFRAGEPGAGVEGTMVFAGSEVSRISRIPTELGSWEMTLAGPEGTDLRLLAVHPGPPAGTADQWRADHAAIRRVAETGVDLAVGDFNATPDHAPMRALEDVGLRSATELANEGWRPTWPDNGASTVFGIPLPRLVEIDHVLVGRSLASLGTHRVRIEGTDHAAVVAEVAVK